MPGKGVRGSRSQRVWNSRAFETELIGAAQHLRHADGVGAELMANLAWIDAKALQSKQHHKGCKPPLIRTPGALTHLIPRRRRSPMDPDYYSR